MTSNGIVIRSMPRTDGSYGVILRLDGVAHRSDPEVYVRSEAELPEGKRVLVHGAGSLWRLG